jgi:hypothetical protein
MDLWDVVAMTALHLALFLPAWWLLTADPAMRRWMRGRLDRE